MPIRRPARRLLAAALLPALLAFVHPAGPGPAASSPAILGQRAVAIPGVRLLGLAPDGRRLLGEGVDSPARLCAYNVANLAEGACADLQAAGYGPRLAVENVAWSSDGGEIAFTEDRELTAREPDVWTFDLTTGKLTDLTDDGVRGGMQRSATSAAAYDLDLWPVWSPDGRELAFVRGHHQAGGGYAGVGLYRIPASGGPARKITPLGIKNPLPVYPTLRWTADGTLVWSVNPNDSANAGLWTVPATGGQPRRLAANGLLVAISARGQALVLSPAALTSRSLSQPYSLVDLTTGATAPLRAPGILLGSWPGEALLTFAPDGKQLLYAAYQPTHHLVLLDLATGAVTTLLDPADVWMGGEAPLGPT